MLLYFVVVFFINAKCFEKYHVKNTISLVANISVIMLSEEFSTKINLSIIICVQYLLNVK